MQGNDRIKTGKRGEDLAAAYLEKAGYKIIERNYRCIFGEIDIVAKDGRTLVFVEVKSRRSDRFGIPQESITFRKQRKITQIAMNYIKERGFDQNEARFDVVSIRMSDVENKVEIIPNAFDLVQ